MTQNSDNPKHYQGYDISGPQTRRLWRIYDLCEVSKGLGGYGGMGGLIMEVHRLKELINEIKTIAYRGITAYPITEDINLAETGVRITGGVDIEKFFTDTPEEIQATWIKEKEEKK